MPPPDAIRSRLKATWRIVLAVTEAGDAILTCSLLVAGHQLAERCDFCTESRAALRSRAKPGPWPVVDEAFVDHHKAGICQDGYMGREVAVGDVERPTEEGKCRFVGLGKDRKDAESDALVNRLIEVSRGVTLARGRHEMRLTCNRFHSPRNTAPQPKRSIVTA